MSLFSQIKMVSYYETVGMSLCNLQFYTFSAHGAHKVVFLDTTVSTYPTIASYTLSPFFAILVVREKPCAERALCISVAYVIIRVTIFKLNFHI